MRCTPFRNESARIELLGEESCQRAYRCATRSGGSPGEAARIYVAEWSQTGKMVLSGSPRLLSRLCGGFWRRLVLHFDKNPLDWFIREIFGKMDAGRRPLCFTKPCQSAPWIFHRAASF